MTPDTARYLLTLDFKEADQQRLEELNAKERAGTLAADEEAELTHYRTVDDLLNRLRDQARKVLQPSEPRVRIAPLMLRSMRAYWRELPELLKVRSRKRQWVSYHGDERIAFGRTDVEVYQECFRRGIERGDFYVGKIEEDETPPWGTLEGDWPLYEVTEGSEEEVSPGTV